MFKWCGQCVVAKWQAIKVVKNGCFGMLARLGFCTRFCEGACLSGKTNDTRMISSINCSLICRTSDGWAMRARGELGGQRMHVNMHENMHLVYSLCERARHVAHLICIPLNRTCRFDQDTLIGVLERHGVGVKLVFEKC